MTAFLKKVSFHLNNMIFSFNNAFNYIYIIYNWSKAFTKLLYALVGYTRHRGIRSSNSGTAQKNVLIASMICWASSLPSGDKQPNLVSRETRPTAGKGLKKLK